MQPLKRIRGIYRGNNMDEFLSYELYKMYNSICVNKKGNMPLPTHKHTHTSDCVCVFFF